MIGRALAATVGALASALGAAACCAPPLLASVFGLTSAGLGGAIQPYRPAFLTASGAFFLLGLVWVRRRERTACRCRDDESRKEAGSAEVESVESGSECRHCGNAGRARSVLWAALFASAALAFYPEWTAWL